MPFFHRRSHSALKHRGSVKDQRGGCGEVRGGDRRYYLAPSVQLENTARAVALLRLTETAVSESERHSTSSLSRFCPEQSGSSLLDTECDSLKFPTSGTTTHQIAIPAK